MGKQPYRTSATPEVEKSLEDIITKFTKLAYLTYGIPVSVVVVASMDDNYPNLDAIHVAIVRKKGYNILNILRETRYVQIENEFCDKAEHGRLSIRETVVKSLNSLVSQCKRVVEEATWK